MKSIAVIGGLYGDEGKGLMTDYICHRERGGGSGQKGIVVRHNGGAQAGHTVVTPGGMRHVFSHFGSGTLLNIPTYLSRFFICNPILFNKEFDALQREAFLSEVIVSPECLVTTPWDMLLNQAREEWRMAYLRGGHHGSCGVGINETIVRSKVDMFRTEDLAASPIFMQHFLRRLVEDYYLPELEKVHASEVMLKAAQSEMMLSNFIGECARFHHRVTYSDFVPIRDFAVYEGAQGLMLDQDHPNFPNVTHSKTGVKNANILAMEVGHPIEEVIYVARCYTTRHGAGHLPFEYGKGVVYEDNTNISHTYQGNLRFAPLDLGGFVSLVSADSLQCPDAKESFAFTHTDQVGDTIEVILDGEVIRIDKADLLVNAQYYSNGPTRNHVKCK